MSIVCVCVSVVCVCVSVVSVCVSCVCPFLLFAIRMKFLSRFSFIIIVTSVSGRIYKF